MKHYLIDSENVGDFWIPLLDLPAEQAELIVFYTKNSPHMSYESLIKLKESDRTVTFIKCYEGTNALDFQLCSELGFLIAQHEGDDFIIVTNDTGYDAAVKYWRRKEYSVKRIAGKDTRTGSRRRGNPVRLDVAAEVSSILNKLVQIPDVDDMEAEEDGQEAVMQDTAAEDSMEFAQADTEYAYDEDEEVLQEQDAEDESDYENPEVEDPDTEDSESEDSDSDDFIYEDPEHDDFPEDENRESEEDGEDEEPEEAVDETADQEDSQEPDEFEEEEDEDLTAEESEKDEEPEEQVKEPEAAEPVKEAPAPLEDLSVGKTDEAEEFHPDSEEITAIVNCIGMENLAELHNQLIQFYGEHGKEIYQSLKSGTLTIEKQGWDKEDKFLYYCALILRHSDEPEEALLEENIRELAEFLLGAENKRKNLNSLRYALLKHYGKEKGRRYYFMLKPYVKALNQM